MNKGILYGAVAFAIITSIAGATEMQAKKYVPYQATIDEIALTKITTKMIYPTNFEKPTNEAVKKRLFEAIKMAEEEESRIRYMVEKDMVKTIYWNGMYSGSVIVPLTKTRYYFIFKSPSLKIQQMDKIVYVDEIYGKEKNLSENYSFMFHEDADCVQSFGYSCGNKKISLSFYPANKIESCGLAIGNKYYRMRWNEEGKLIDKSVRTLKQ